MAALCQGGLGGVSDVTAVIRTSSIFGTRGIAAMLRYRGVRSGALSLPRNVTLCLKETWAPIAMGTPYFTRRRTVMKLKQRFQTGHTSRCKTDREKTHSEKRYNYLCDTICPESASVLCVMMMLLVKAPFQNNLQMSPVNSPHLSPLRLINLC
jgi:hypothetical protein